MKKYLGYLMLVIAILPVAVFLGVHEIAFFNSTFAEENQHLSPFGYMMTGGGVFVWIGILSWHARGGLQKAVSFVMIVVCSLGALGAALFNMYANTIAEAGFTLTRGEIKAMTMLIGVLAIVHMGAAILEFAGESIIKAWKEDDSPNA